ncbi:PREDICTED: uncharacterized protein LOC104802388 [Tarenaya hassleriana]|uniref:uncharacterized protein LOC104802388 n=1 Tax=Tarenaya hassleriana TaxID=28532 RepID=UPI00053C5E8E|nr:PREDICTED: uncharacterized protein LOC104802388 [Tarenaya hassleriana]
MCRKTPAVGEEKQETRTTTRHQKTSPDNPKKKKQKKPSESTHSKTPSNLGPSRKIRTRTRKPKYLSLRLELTTSHHESRAENDPSSKKTTKKKKSRKQNKSASTDMTTEMGKKEQLDLFPLHPEAPSDKESYGDYQYDAVTAYLFNSATDSTISSIHDLLDSSAGDAGVPATGILSPFDHRDPGSSSLSLVRTAMRRGASQEAEKAAEERWVSYSEVVEEVMSRSGTPRWCGGGYDGEEESGGGGRPSLALKLDYEQIKEAWSDKGSLYVDGEPPQTVPDLHAQEGAGMSVWAVPEMEETERARRGRREASLLRYKEKRQSRLFAKRIRYEVRKLNAEKRPRLKGRFVKRAETEAQGPILLREN